MRHPWELARFEVVMRLLEREGLLEAPRTILDLGCGDAFFVQQMSLRLPGSKFWAIDTAMDPIQLREVSEQLEPMGIIVSDSLEKIQPSKGNEASLVLLLDVIEHVEDDLAFLADLRGQHLLSSDATVIITVPAFQSLFCSHDTFLGHYRRYDHAMLEERVRSTGWIPVKGGYFFITLLVLRWLQVIGERVLKTEPGTESTGLVKWQGGWLKTTLLKSWLKFDFEIGSMLLRLGIRLPGLSNYIVCRKS